jgi:hypothetical protein
MSVRLQRQMYGWLLLFVYFRNTRGGLMACVHCTQLETLSSGRSGGVLASHSDSCPLSTSCHHSHSCRSSRSCCMETLRLGLVCLSAVHTRDRNNYGNQTNENYLSELPCYLSVRMCHDLVWEHRTQKCLHMLIFPLSPNKIKAWNNDYKFFTIIGNHR